jgi:hypothetical protein
LIVQTIRSFAMNDAKQAGPRSAPKLTRVEGERCGPAHREGDSATMALEALENVSRRIDVLARELNCLGWFGDDEGPRAA